MKKLILAIVLMVTSLQAGAWQYSDKVDQMRGTKDSYAYTTSNNSVNFPFPYSGGSNLQIHLRKSAKYGTDAMLIISKGQFTCMMGCTVHVKFDNGKIESFSASGAENGSTDVIFIDSYSRFVSKLKKAQKVIVEADFYDSGSKQFQFNVSGLKWH